MENRVELQDFLSDVIQDCINALRCEDYEDMRHRTNEMVDWISANINVSDFKSEDVPDGYDTIVHYLAVNAKAYLNTLDDPFRGTTRLGFKMIAYCKNLNYEVVKVSSPEEFKKWTDTINAYPVEALDLGLLNMLD